MTNYFGPNEVSPTDVINIAVQLLEGIEYIHNAGIAHMDIASDNVMVTHDGYVKYIDFGKACLEGYCKLESRHRDYRDESFTTLSDYQQLDIVHIGQMLAEFILQSRGEFRTTLKRYYKLGREGNISVNALKHSRILSHNRSKPYIFAIEIVKMMLNCKVDKCSARSLLDYINNH